MKKILAGISLLLLLTACSNSKVKTEDLVKKYSLTKASTQNWEYTISNVIFNESSIPEWFGDEDPLMYLRKYGKLTDKDLYFLEALGKINPSQISDEDYERFLDLLTRYVEGLPRRFFLEDTNIKDPKGLVDYMVKTSLSQIDTPSKYIKEYVADKEEWDKIIEMSQKDDLNSKDVKKLRKLLNAFIKRDNLFNEKVWYNQEISDRVIQISELNKKYSDPKTKIQLNNINAKAIYIAYPGFFSKMDRWGK